MKLLPEVIGEIESYLSLIDRLYWSSINKNFSTWINRKKINSYISAIILTHYMEWSFSDDCVKASKFNKYLVGPINHPPARETLAHEIKCFMTPESSYWSLRVLGDEMLSLYNIHTHPFWFRYQKCYLSSKLILSSDIWDPNPRILQNQRVCAIYRCRKLGVLRKKILESLVLKSLVN